MTHGELMAIPEWPTQFGVKIIVRDGKKIRIPVLPPAVVMFDPIRYIDASGHAWTVGMVNGVQYRQLFQANNAVSFSENT